MQREEVGSAEAFRRWSELAMACDTNPELGYSGQFHMGLVLALRHPEYAQALIRSPEIESWDVVAPIVDEKVATLPIVEIAPYEGADE